MQAYDNYDYPSYWDHRSYEHESERIAINELLKNFDLQSFNNVIDIGGGFGRLIPVYERYCKNITLAEPSITLIDRAKEDFKGIKFGKKVNYIHTNVEDLSKKVKQNSFDLALMIRVMHHIEKPEVVFSTVSKILKNNGYFLFEFANKVHGKAVFGSLLRGDFTFSLDLSPQSKLSRKNKDIIPFLNYHPDIIKYHLSENNLEIKEILSVSNFRSGLIKSILPLPTLLKIEKMFQKPLASISFGPSTFILAQKVKK